MASLMKGGDVDMIPSISNRALVMVILLSGALNASEASPTMPRANTNGMVNECRGRRIR